MCLRFPACSELITIDIVIIIVLVHRHRRNHSHHNHVIIITIIIITVIILMMQRYDDQWWIGATVHGPHGDHNYGNWTWDHTGTEITWYGNIL